MKIVVNGEPKDVINKILSAVLQELGFEGAMATAVNENFVAASQRDSLVLSDSDRLEVLAPMQGG